MDDLRKVYEKEAYFHLSYTQTAIEHAGIINNPLKWIMFMIITGDGRN